MSKTYEQIVAELDAKIPRDVVKEREGGGGRTFSYLEGHYVIARLNEVFGQGYWSYVTKDLRMVHSGMVKDRYNKDVYSTHYIAVVQLQAEIGGRLSTFAEVGYGDGTDKTNPGKAHELAAKEAVTDALKRAAKNLGMSMGLALYDKTQENVDDGEENVRGSNGASSGPGEVQRPAAQAAKRGKPTAKAPPVEAKGETSGGASIPETPPEDFGELMDMINALSKAACSRAGVPRKDEKLKELRTYLRDTYKVQKKEELSPEQAKEFYTYLRGQVA